MNTARSKSRCAVYCRKSSEEGLGQAFNSLDAQREACLAYIESQRREGWIALDHEYSDPGYSGGSLDRPALQRLLRDIESGSIDTIVCYRIDRLTRSLIGFTRLVEILDRHSVALVSITESFNTGDFARQTEPAHDPELCAIRAGARRRAHPRQVRGLPG
jgi:site-specific DNA recombinase